MIESCGPFAIARRAVQQQTCRGMHHEAVVLCRESKSLAVNDSWGHFWEHLFLWGAVDRWRYRGLEFDPHTLKQTEATLDEERP